MPKLEWIGLSVVVKNIIHDVSQRAVVEDVKSHGYVLNFPRESKYLPNDETLVDTEHHPEWVVEGLVS